MKRVHIIGRKNSGKTTLIVELVERLTQRGVRVGTIKHTHHRHELDTPGKDSQRHRLAGAYVVAVVSPHMTAVFQPQAAEETKDARYERLQPVLQGCDLVLVEGDSQTEWPKVEVWRAATGTEPLASVDRAIAAVVTDDHLRLPVPIWSRSDIDTMAEALLELAR